MQKRFVSIWFRSLKTDWFIRRNPALKELPFILVKSDHGRMVVTAASELAHKQGIEAGISLADARAIIAGLQFFEEDALLENKLLKGIAEYCIRFTPYVSIDPPDGLMLNATGCAHLWSGEKEYLTEMHKRFTAFGYAVRLAIADTIGAAWAVSRFGKNSCIVKTGEQTNAILFLPPSALRIEPGVSERLQKLGLTQVKNFIGISPAALRRRFGPLLVKRLNQALGTQDEIIQPVHEPVLYHERLPCMEPIITATGIRIALQRLIETICARLIKEEKGIRLASFMGYRLDGKMEKIDIGTNRPSRNSHHLFKLFEIKIETIEPASGIELFTLEAHKVEDLSSTQEDLFAHSNGLSDTGLAELLDRIGGKIGAEHIHRYLPDEHYWPERSYKPAAALDEKPQAAWKAGRPRPIQLLPNPEFIEVTAPIPDYPPMNFRYRGKLHKIIKADGPERIEQEWWLQQGVHRDYYYVEDEEGYRYWLFRSGHYDISKTHKWFIHGFFP